MKLSKIYYGEDGFPENIVKKILANIKTFSHDKLKKDYVEELLVDYATDILIVVNDTSGAIRGFACVSEYKEDGEEYCSLDLLCCAKKHSMKRRSNYKIPNGKYLLDKVENIVKSDNKYIEVNAIPTAILYYYKNGYYFESNKYQKRRLKSAMKNLNKIYNSSKNDDDLEDNFRKIKFLDRYIDGYYDINDMSSKKLWKDIEENSSTLEEYKEGVSDDGYNMIKFFH